MSSPQLFPVSGRAPLGIYLQQLWDARHFIRTQAFARASSRYEGMLLGNVWSILSPMLEAFGYYLIFGLLLKVNRGVENFPAFLVVGIYLFTYTMRTVSGSAGVMQTNRNLIRAFSFPRMALPISLVLREAVSLIPTLVVLFGFIMINPPHELPHQYWILLPVILLMQTVFNLGLALILARATDGLPDLKQLITFVTRFLMYLSGVMFPLERFVDHPGVMRVMELNPLYQVLMMARKVLLYESLPTSTEWIILAAWAIGALLIGSLYFWQGEVNYGRQGL